MTGDPAAATAVPSGGSTIGVALPAKTSENWVLAGDLFTQDLTDAGFKPDVQYAAASGTVANQQDEIQSMVTKGAKVIIIGAADGGQLGTQVKAAHDAGAVVIAYDRLILNTEDVDYYVAYDNFKVGELQGQALLDGMAAKKAEGPYNIELFAGSPDDNNAKVFFDGAMDVLKPKIDDGTLKIVSGQTTFEQAVTQGWKAENAQKRMDTLLAGSYTGSTPLAGVLSPWPGIDDPDQVLRTVETFHHPVGSCRMGRDDDPDAVVDARGRVRGLDGLWIIDASVIARVPSANTHLAVIALAVTAGLKVEDIVDSLLVHPSLSEALAEAAD